MQPTVTAKDMGLFKPYKFQYWCPWPIWYTKDGRGMHVSRGLYSSKQRAETALALYLSTIQPSQKA